MAGPTGIGEAIRNMLASGRNYTQIREAMGCSKGTIAHHARGLGMPRKRYSRMRLDEANLRDLAASCASVSEMMRRSGTLVGGGSHASIKSALLKYGIAIPNGHNVNRGPRYVPPVILVARRQKVIDSLTVRAAAVGTDALKKSLFRYEIKEKRCESCGITEWMGRPAPLELHHLNGVRLDNRLENLQILCSNCHALTETYCGRNVKLKRQAKAA